MGPAAVRYAGLNQRLKAMGLAVQDFGDVPIALRDTLPPEGGLAYLPAVVEACEAIYRFGCRSLDDGGLPVFLGGDHSLAMGTVAAAASRGSVGLLWVDAHGDFNTAETSPSGNLHGMPLAALTGRGVRELVDIGRPGAKVADRDVVILGVRDLDPPERQLIREAGVTAYTMRDVDERGIGAVAHEALAKLAHVEHLHVSLDMDVLDPTEAPGVGTPVAGGLSYREAHVLMEILADSGRLCSMDVVEINPILDQSNLTANVAVELVLSALGKKIL